MSRSAVQRPLETVAAWALLNSLGTGLGLGIFLPIIEKAGTPVGFAVAAMALGASLTTAQTLALRRTEHRHIPWRVATFLCISLGGLLAFQLTLVISLASNEYSALGIAGGIFGVFAGLGALLALRMAAARGALLLFGSAVGFGLGFPLGAVILREADIDLSTPLGWAILGLTAGALAGTLAGSAIMALPIRGNVRPNTD